MFPNDTIVTLVTTPTTSNLTVWDNIIEKNTEILLITQILLTLFSFILVLLTIHRTRQYDQLLRTNAHHHQLSRISRLYESYNQSTATSTLQ